MSLLLLIIGLMFATMAAMAAGVAAVVIALTVLSERRQPSPNHPAFGNVVPLRSRKGNPAS